MSFFQAHQDGNLRPQHLLVPGENPNCDIEGVIPSLATCKGEIKLSCPIRGGTGAFINAGKALLWSPGGLGSVVIKLGLNLRYSPPCLE